MTLNVAGFKAYDVRGRVPDELNEEIAFAIGRAYAQFLAPETVVVGHDIRLSSPMITNAMVDGLLTSGVNVQHLGMCGTEEIYFATDHFGFDGGIIVTASHNPKDYNGMKLVRRGSRPISGDTGLAEIRDLTSRNSFPAQSGQGEVTPLDHKSAYIDCLLGYVDRENLKPLKIVVNPGNGAAGPVIEALERELPFGMVKLHFEPDGSFPNGVPNPLLPENRAPTIDALQKDKADIAVAWDGDFDRCFLFDETGRFIEGYYIVGLLAQAFLEKSPGSAIVHDPRLMWNTEEIVAAGQGRSVMSKTGHAFIKERMRKEDAIYGGEMSAHHYFRDFAYSDSGMIPWMLVADLMSRKDMKLSEMVDERMTRFPCSGEINRRIEDPVTLLAELESRFRDQAVSIDATDGLSMSFDDWRFNLRSSNTEPVVRLNVETRGNQRLMESRTDELLVLMGGEPA